MNHVAVVPVVLPLFAAAVLVLLSRTDLRLQRAASFAAMLASLAAAIALVALTSRSGHVVYRVGGWPAPFAIVLVVDRLAAAMLALADVVSLAALVHAMTSRGDARGRHFHVFLHAQVAGVHGAFLTGDFFNLFVFFEILLIASYGLVLHGKGRPRMRAALPYVIINLVGSAIFLVGLAVLYGTTGALNMAQVAVRASELTGGDARLLRTAFALLVVVFALKAGLVPLHFWLTRAYPAARSEVAASFAIMTKVGVYGIVRVMTLVPEAASDLSAWLLPLALTTQIVGALGALASRTVRRMQAHLLVSSVGLMLTGIALQGAGSLAAALFYLGHSTPTVAAAFLLAGAVARVRRENVARRAILVGAFLFVSVAIAGLPPLSGFIGKAALLGSVPPGESRPIVFAVVLVSSLLALVACARAGSAAFWGGPTTALLERQPPLRHHALFGLLAVISALTVLAGPAMEYAARTAAQLLDRPAYVGAVLGGES